MSADQLPTAVAVDLDTGASVTTSVVTPETVTGENYDYYWVTLDPTEVTYNRKVRLTWSYLLEGDEYKSQEDIHVVTPLASIEAIYWRYPQFQAGGSQEKTYDEIKDMERKVRFVIQAYTGQVFQDLGSKVFREYGPGSNYLGLSEPIYELEYVAAENPKIVLYDNQTPDASGEIFERDDNGELTSDKRFVREPIEIVTWDQEKPWVVRRKFTMSENWNNMYPRQHISAEWLETKRIFQSKRMYIIRAKTGWRTVPPQVTESALLLIGDYFCPDVTWHERQLGTVTSADYNFKFDVKHYETTGNVFVDQMLSEYIENRMFVF